MGWYEDRFKEHPGRHPKDCAACGRKMWLPSSKLADFHCCSAGCSTALRRASMKEREKKCATCGALFIPRPRQLRLGGGVFCSQACNKNGHSAMNSEVAQKLARLRWKERHAIQPIVKAGVGNPRWSGGPIEKKRRDRENGWPSQAARRAKAGAKIQNGVIQRIGNSQKWKCAVCGYGVKNKYHVDHIVPLKLGGKHAPSNIQILCPGCNLTKAAKDPIAFMQSRGFLL